MKLKLWIVVMTCSLIALSVHSFEKSDNNKGKSVKDDHYLQGKEIYEKLNYDSLWNEASDIYTDEGQALVNGCIEKYGGHKHLESVNSLKLEYQSETVLLNKDQIITKYFQKGRKHKTTISENGEFVKARIINGSKAWDITPEITQEIILQEYKKELFEYIQQNMPLGIDNETFTGIRYGKRENDDLQYIYLQNNDTLMTILGINPDDYLIHKIEGVIIQDDNRFVFIYFFSEFKDFQGFIFPSKRKYVSMGLEVSNSNLISVEINPIFDENEFIVQE